MDKPLTRPLTKKKIRYTNYPYQDWNMEYHYRSYNHLKINNVIISGNKLKKMMIWTNSLKVQNYYGWKKLDIETLNNSIFLQENEFTIKPPLQQLQL